MSANFSYLSCLFEIQRRKRIFVHTCNLFMSAGYQTDRYRDSGLSGHVPGLQIRIPVIHGDSVLWRNLFYVLYADALDLCGNQLDL